MPITARQIAKFSLRLFITAALLIWVFSRIDIQQLNSAIKDIRWPFILANCGLGVLFYLAASIKTRFILKKQNCNVSIATLFGISAITVLYGLVTPGLLNATIKWYLLKKNTNKGTYIFSGMVYNQLTETVVVIVFGLIALIVTNPTRLLLPNVRNQYILPTVSGILLTGIIIISLLLLNRRTGSILIRIFRRIIRFLPVKMRHKADETLTQTVDFQVAGWRFHCLIVAITIAMTILSCVFAFILSAKGANIKVSIGVLVWLSATVGILGKIPISIANLGVREVTLVQFLAFYNIEPSAALLMSMIFFSGAVFMALVGAGYQIFWTVKPEKLISGFNKNT
jgi:uncharacterized membrane protein YbhN (UPF0104 family)